MQLYHFTSYENGTKIINEKIMKIDKRSRLSGDFATTSGYLYFTTINRAIYMGHSSTNGNNNYFYVFRANIPDEYLLVDYDEYKIWDKESPENNKDYRRSLEEVCSVRVGHDIDKAFELSYLLVPHRNMVSTNWDDSELIFIRDRIKYHLYEDKDIQTEYEKHFKGRWIKI